VIADLNRDIGEETAAEVDAGFVRIDVASAESVGQVVADLFSVHGVIDIWVNNAGIDRNAPGEEMSDKDWRDVMAVNLDGTFYCCREVGRHMLERGHGAIVNIASMSGIVSNHPQPQVAFNASKAGVIMLTKSLAGEWARRGRRHASPPEALPWSHFWSHFWSHSCAFRAAPERSCGSPLSVSACS